MLGTRNDGDVLSGWLPALLVLVCPLVMVLMMLGMRNSGGRSRDAEEHERKGE